MNLLLGKAQIIITRCPKDRVRSVSVSFRPCSNVLVTADGRRKRRGEGDRQTQTDTDYEHLTHLLILQRRR